MGASSLDTKYGSNSNHPINKETYNCDVSDCVANERELLKKQSGTNNNWKPKQKSRSFLFVLGLLGAVYGYLLSGIYNFGINVVYVEVVKIFDISRSKASILVVIQSIFALIYSFVSKELVNRIGPGACMFLGAFISSVGCVGAAFSSNFAVFIFSYGILTGSGATLIFVSVFLAPSHLFDTEKSQKKFTMVITIVSGGGNAVGSLIMETLFERLGYHTALIVLAGLFIQGCVGYIAMWSVERKGHKSMESLGIKEWKHQLKTLFQNTSFVMYVVTDFLRFFVYASYSALQVDHIISIGFDIETGAFFAFLLGLSSLGGRIVNGFIVSVKRWHGIYHYSILSFLFGGGVMAMAFLESYYALLVANCFIGLIGGALFDFVYLFLYEIMSPDTYAYGVTVHIAVFGVSSLIVTPLGGWIRDTTGSYRTLFYLALPMCGTSALSYSVFHFLRTRRGQKKDSYNPL